MNNFIELIEYNTWANKRLLCQLKELPEEYILRDVIDGFPSIHQAIYQLLRSDRIWLDRWKGHWPTEIPGNWNTLTLKGMEVVWNDLQTDTLSWLRLVLPRAIDHEITISDRSGTTTTLKFSQTVNLVLNHASHYRGQLTNVVSALGLDPVKTQLLDYYTRIQDPSSAHAG